MSKSTRYFKATIGERVYFRASETRVYASAQMINGRSLGFSGKPAALGASPCTEITKAEYAQLIALKQQRVIESGGNVKYENSPQDSWVAVEVAAGVVA
jgi:hypothetical protein